MSSKALDEIIKFTFTRSTHYYRVADLLIDNQNNILQVRSASIRCILLPALASVENWQRDLSVAETFRDGETSHFPCVPQTFLFLNCETLETENDSLIKRNNKNATVRKRYPSTWQEPSESVTWSYRKTLQTLYKTKQWKILKISPSMFRLIKEKVFNLFQVVFSLALLWLV